MAKHESKLCGLNRETIEWQCCHNIQYTDTIKGFVQSLC